MTERPSADGPDRGRVPLKHRERFDGVSADAAQAVAALFGVEVLTEPYAPADGESVFAIEHRGEPGNLRLVLWPPLARVDAHCGPHTWVAKGIIETEVIDGLEAIFRTADGATLFAALAGDVLMVTGGSLETTDASA
ncbi:MAG TPA: hypothetical protein QGF05_00045 [Dehalococcoidia bacterium]|nr:hypothetical protein [Dehalococcoidia bacterium]